MPILLAALAPGPASADYAESYRQGLRAVDFKEWSRAAVLMRQAISQQPAGAIGTSVRIYGTRFERYLPYYYLGLALYRQQDCRGALESFETARAAAALGGVQLGKLRIYEDVCRQRLGLGTPTRIAASGAGSATSPGSRTGRPSASRSAGAPPGTGAGGRAGRPSAPRRSGSPPGTGAGSGAAGAAGALPAPSGAGSGASTSPPSPGSTTQDVRRRHLDKAATQAERELRRGESVAERLEAMRRTASAAFRRDPGLGQTLDAARRLLEDVRFLFEASRRERDLAGLERARDEAQAAADELEDVARSVGI